MFRKNGFTLLEIIVVLVILGILATIAVSTYSTSLNQAVANSAYQNMLYIKNAQQTYLYTSGKYCGSIPAQGIVACQDNAHINSSLNLRIDNTFQMFCQVAMVPGNPNQSVLCSASNSSDNVILSLASLKPGSPSFQCFGNDFPNGCPSL